eukprot:gene1620-11558_t
MRVAAAASLVAPLCAAAPLTCADLKSTDGPYDLSHEGSWSYLRLKKDSFALGAMGYSSYSDWSPREGADRPTETELRTADHQIRSGAEPVGWV